MDTGEKTPVGVRFPAPEVDSVPLLIVAEQISERLPIASVGRDRPDPTRPR